MFMLAEQGVLSDSVLVGRPQDMDLSLRSLVLDYSVVLWSMMTWLVTDVLQY